MSVLLALLTAIASSDAPEAVHGGLSLGIGSAYDAAGIRGEIGSNHLGVFVGTGLLTGAFTTQTTASSLSLSFGARWYSGVRRGWLASLNFTQTWWSEYSVYDVRETGAPTNPGRLFTVGGVAGYRFMADRLFFEIGLGALWYRHRDTFTCTNIGTTCVNLPAKGPLSYGWFPDAVIGFGFDL